MYFNKHYHPYPLIDPRRKIAMFWTPKCACTSLGYWFFEQMGLEQHVESVQGQNIGAKLHHYRDNIHFNTSPIQSKIAYRYLVMIPRLVRLYRDESYFKFTIVRDPVSRIVSSFMSLNSNIQSWSRFCRALRTGEDRLCFNSFLSLLSKRLDYLHKDPHFRPQTQFDCWKPPCKLQAVIKLERLDDEIRHLSTQLGLKDIPVRRLYATKHAKTRRDAKTESVAQTPYDVLTAGSETLPHPDQFLDQTSIGLIKQLYLDDFTKLKYDIP